MFASRWCQTEASSRLNPRITPRLPAHPSFRPSMPVEKAAAKVEQRDSQDARQLWTRKHQTLQLASDDVPTVPTSEACCETCCAALSLITLHWSIQPLLAASRPSTNVCSSHKKTPPPGQASLGSGKTKPRKGSRHQTHALLLAFGKAPCGF